MGYERDGEEGMGKGWGREQAHSAAANDLWGADTFYSGPPGIPGPPLQRGPRLCGQPVSPVRAKSAKNRHTGKYPVKSALPPVQYSPSDILLPARCPLYPLYSIPVKPLATPAARPLTRYTASLYRPLANPDTRYTGPSIPRTLPAPGTADTGTRHGALHCTVHHSDALNTALHHTK